MGEREGTPSRPKIAARASGQGTQPSCTHTTSLLLTAEGSRQVPKWQGQVAASRERRETTA